MGSREAFVRLANARVQKAERVLRQIGKLSNRSSYVWDDTDAKAIIERLETTLATVRAKFNDGRGEDVFKLE